MPTTIPLYDPSTHPDWLTPHSLEWYDQLGSTDGKYTYPWNSTLARPNGENLFDELLAAQIPGKIVLDVGCGHGEFTLQWAQLAAKIVGFDVVDDFLATGEALSTGIEFVAGTTKQDLPFADDAFDLAYTRRGPGSWYRFANRIVKPGGKIIGLHPADASWHELPELFPGLFPAPPQGTPILDRIRNYLAESGLADLTIETIFSTETFHRPEDILRFRCFGQQATVAQATHEQALAAVTEIFERHAGANGLPITHACYLVRATAQG